MGWATDPGVPPGGKIVNSPLPLSGSLSSPRDLAANPTRIPPEVKDSDYLGFVLRFHIVDAKREPIGQHSETTILPPVNSMVQGQAFDVRQQGSHTILANTLFAPLMDWRPYQAGERPCWRLASER